MVLYVNGRKVAAEAYKRTLPTFEVLHLGKRAQFPDSGVMDEFRLSKVARYTDDFRPPQRFEADAHTVVLYHFDEGQGDVLKDSSGNNHHGKIVGGKWTRVETSTVADPDRIAAEWVMSVGGRAQTDKGHFRRGDVLPSEPFQLQLIDIKLSQNVSDRDIEKLVGLKHIHALHVLQSRLTGACGQYIKSLTSLTEIKATVEDGDLFLSHVSKLFNVTHITLHDCNITNAGLAHIGTMTQLTELAMAGNAISSGGLKHLSGLRKLLKLNLGGSRITDADLADLAPLSYLSQLMITETNLTDAALEHIKKLERLTLLRLEQSAITQAGIDDLQKSLPDCKLQWEPNAGSPSDAIELTESITPADGEVSLIPLVDTSKDVFKGSWRKEEDKLFSNVGNLKLPVSVDGDYELRVVWHNVKLDNHILAFTLPVADQSAGGLAGYTGIFNLTDKDRANPKTVSLEPRKPGRHEYRVAVTTLPEKSSARIQVHFDGKQLFDWTAPMSELSPLRQPHIRLNSAALVETEFSVVTLKMLSGSAKLLRPMPRETSGLTKGPPLAVAPFDAAAAKAHQEAWAKHLDEPIEKEVVLPGNVRLTLVLVPPGEFAMGSTPEKIAEDLATSQKYKDYVESIQSEVPRHTVRLTRPFYVGKYEVTQEQYEAIAKTNPSVFAAMGLQSELVADIDTSRHPVENVKWNAAVDFCRQLGTHLGREVRLPTEAEWEYSARAGTQTAYWTTGELKQAAWVSRSGGMTTHPVGELLPNPFGLHDVHGNVAEWVQDPWAADYYGEFADSIAVDPTGPPPTGQDKHQLRGGWFDYEPGFARSARRIQYATKHSRSHGLRVVVPIGPENLKAASARSTRTQVDAVANKELLTLSGHAKPIVRLAFGPGGKTLVSADSDTIKLWDTASGDEKLSLVTALSEITSLAISPDGKMLASGSSDAIKVWDIPSGQVRFTLSKLKGAVGALTFSPDSQTLAAGHHDLAEFWNVASGQSTGKHNCYKYIKSLAFSPNGSTLAAGCEGRVQFLDAPSSKLQFEIMMKDGSVTAVAFSPDGKALIAGSQRDSLKLWDLETKLARHALSGHTGGLTDVAFSRDGMRIVSVCSDGIVKQWDADTGAERGQLPTVGPVSAFSTDGTRLASQDVDDPKLIVVQPAASTGQ